MSLRVILFILCAYACANAQADAPPTPQPSGAAEGAAACSLTNGDRISGKVLDVSPAGVSLATDYVGEVTIPRAAISFCDAADAGRQATLFSLFSPEGEASAAAPDGGASPDAGVVAAGQERPTYDAESTTPEVWKRSLNFSYAFASGNADVSDMNVAAAVTRKSENDELSLSALVRRGVKNGQDFAALFATKARYDRNFALKVLGETEVSLFNEVGYEKDALKKLDRRLSWNGGMSVPFLSGEGRRLSFDFGGGLTRENYSTSAGRTIGSGLLRLRGEQRLFGGASVRHEVTAFPVFEDLGRYRLDAEVTLRAPLTKVLSLSVGGTNRFDRRPPGGVERNDFSLQSGVAWEF